MIDSIQRTKPKDFAKDIVFLCRYMKANRVEFALINQLLRCGTSVGANIHEAQYDQGKNDFISKMEIALKECNESDYWVELLYDTNNISANDFDRLKKQIIEIRRTLVSSVTTLKNTPPSGTISCLAAFSVANYLIL